MNGHAKRMNVVNSTVASGSDLEMGSRCEDGMGEVDPTRNLLGGRKATGFDAGYDGVQRIQLDQRIYRDGRD